jgi:hypothetical protein
VVAAAAVVAMEEATDMAVAVSAVFQIEKSKISTVKCVKMLNRCADAAA